MKYCDCVRLYFREEGYNDLGGSHSWEGHAQSTTTMFRSTLGLVSRLDEARRGCVVYVHRNTPLLRYKRNKK